jgi:hypothetical protein
MKRINHLKSFSAVRKLTAMEGELVGEGVGEFEGEFVGCNEIFADNIFH